jgi:hypothetical protein
MTALVGAPATRELGPWGQAPQRQRPPSKTLNRGGLPTGGSLSRCATTQHRQSSRNHRQNRANRLDPSPRRVMAHVTSPGASTCSPAFIGRFLPSRDVLPASRTLGSPAERYRARPEPAGSHTPRRAPPLTATARLPPIAPARGAHAGRSPLSESVQGTLLMREAPLAGRCRTLHRNERPATS